MKCECFQNGVQFHDELFEYLDGSLSASAQAAVEAHLTKCIACRQAVQAHRALADRFQRETEFLTLRPGLLNRVLSATQPPPVSRLAADFWRRLAWPAAIAAALLVAAGLSFRWPFHSRVSKSDSAQMPALETISIHFSFCEPTYTFRREQNRVIDALTCTPHVVEENLSLSLNQKHKPLLQDSKTPL